MSFGLLDPCAIDIMQISCVYVLVLWLQLAVVRQVLRKELGLKIVEVESDKASLEGGDVLWTGQFYSILTYARLLAGITGHR